MLVIGALLMGGFFLWTQDTRRGTQHPEYSVRRADSLGAAVVYRLYQDAGLKPQEWDESFTRLKQPGTVIMIAPSRPHYLKLMGQNTDREVSRDGEFFPDELKALDDWVKQGNTAIIFSRTDNDLYGALGLIADQPNKLSGSAATPTGPSLLAQKVSGLKTYTQFGFKYGRKSPKTEDGRSITQTYPIDPIPSERWLTLFQKKEGPRTVSQVVMASRGKGIYLAVNDASPAGNVGIAEEDNARFMLNLASLNPAGGTLWFDEYHKRTAERNLVSYLKDRELFPALVYAALLVGLIFWRTGTRFGAAQPVVPDHRRDSAEYLGAVAALYKNAHMSREALGTVYADFRRRLQGALRLDGLTDLNEVGRRYEQRTGRPAIEARQVLIETEAALARKSLTEAEALQFCARLTQLDQVLHQRAPEEGRRRKP
jgi:hypothetical protein